MKQFCILAVLVLPGFLLAQNVGIGTTAPLSRLHVEQGNVLFIGPSNLPATASPVPVSGAGTRLMWYPDMGAFRAGAVSGNAWNTDSIGRYSIAAGINTRAAGAGSVAMGNLTAATGIAATSFGHLSSAIGDYSTAIGEFTKAEGSRSIAMGSGSNAIGVQSISIGRNNDVLGVNAIALGVLNSAKSNNSTAIGAQNIAENDFATAIGRSNTAGGFAALAFGNGSIARGGNSTAIGYFNTAIGANAVAIGSDNTASALNSMAWGKASSASGPNSTAIGYINSASGNNAVAIGSYAVASGVASFAIGSYVSTSGFTGAFALGDMSTTLTMQSFVDNGFRARFAGGYRLFTNSAVTIGAFLNSGANSWAALSDKRMKENFLPVDGESFLKHIAAMPLTTWNYKGQDVKTMRHYGPMAQDFYTAFGKDALGEIGCDTLINQQDFLGVNLIAIQALEKRTEKINQLEEKMEKLEKENAWLKEQLNAVMDKVKTVIDAGKLGK